MCLCFKETCKVSCVCFFLAVNIGYLYFKSFFMGGSMEGCVFKDEDRKVNFNIFRVLLRGKSHSVA